jgi:hypothetical protein
MTNHNWAAGAAQCAYRRANQHSWGTPRYQREFDTYSDLIVLDWRWQEHPPERGGQAL